MTKRPLLLRPPAPPSRSRNTPTFLLLAVPTPRSSLASAAKTCPRAETSAASAGAATPTPTPWGVAASTLLTTAREPQSHGDSSRCHHRHRPPQQLCETQEPLDTPIDYISEDVPRLSSLPQVKCGCGKGRLSSPPSHPPVSNSDEEDEHSQQGRRKVDTPFYWGCATPSKSLRKRSAYCSGLLPEQLCSRTQKQRRRAVGDRRPRLLLVAATPFSAPRPLTFT